MCRRCDERIARGSSTALEQACLEVYDQIIGLELDNIVVDGSIVEASPAAGRRQVVEHACAHRTSERDHYRSQAPPGGPDTLPLGHSIKTRTLT